MAVQFWHDTMHNSYVSPCKILLWSSFPADPPKNFALGSYFISTMKAVPIACAYLAWLQQLQSGFPALGNN